MALLVGVLAVAIAHASGYLSLRFVTQLDQTIADARLRALMPRTLDPRVVIVDVDEKSLAEIGRWPWGRDQMAALTDELFLHQRAAVVGFDMLFAEPDTGSGLPVLERLAAKCPSWPRGCHAGAPNSTTTNVLPGLWPGKTPFSVIT